MKKTLRQKIEDLVQKDYDDDEDFYEELFEINEKYT